MCLIAFNTNEHDLYQLILISNRDEFYERPTLPAAYWEDNPNILAGRDLKQFGTWLGVDTSGRLAALTNYRDMSLEKERSTSRGDLVRNFLTQTLPATDYLKKLKDTKSNYNGYNLLVGNKDQLYYYGNQANEIIKLTPGTYGLSNHLLDTPWPKVESIKTKLDTYIHNKLDLNTDDLFNILLDSEKALDNELPETGINKELEKELSSIFIKTKGYGTRASTIVLIDYEGKVSFIERTFIDGLLDNENNFTFYIE